MKKRGYFFLLLVTLGIGYLDLNESLSEPTDFAAASVTNLRELSETDSKVQKRRVSSKQDLKFEDPQSFFEMQEKNWGIMPYHEHQSVEFRTPLGRKIKYSFSQDGVPIVGMEILVSLSKRGEVVEVENQYRPLKRVDLSAVNLRGGEVMERIQQRFSVAEPTTELSPILFVREEQEPEAAYLVTVHDRLNKNKTIDVLVSAKDGVVLQKSFSRSEF